MDFYVMPEDCEIVRNKIVQGCAALMDCDGAMVFMVDNYWSDAQIFEVLDIINGFYDLGVDAGRDDKARQIKKALNIK